METIANHCEKMKTILWVDQQIFDVEEKVNLPDSRMARTGRKIIDCKLHRKGYRLKDAVDL